MTDLLKSAIYGFAVGDALGVPHEFKKRGKFTCKSMRGHGTWNQPVGTWSDDTSMTLATLDSIHEKGRIDCDDLRQKFCEWAYRAKYTAGGKTFDIGYTTAQALMSGHGAEDFYNNGNGSLMRMLPLAFINCSNEEICKVSSITHAHKISTDICVKYVKLTKRLIKTRDIKSAFKSEYNRYINKPEYEIKSTGFIIDTFDAAKWCLINSNSYKECVLKAANLGGDTDTIAAIAGGWAGIVYGYKNIPLVWRMFLKNKKLINEVLNGKL